MYLTAISFIILQEIVAYGVHVSDSSLQTFSEQLLPLDVNNAGRWITLDTQKRINFDTATDEASKVLFHLNNEVFNIPTVSKLIKLFDNYDVDSFHNEIITPDEKKEENEVIDTFLNTSVMSYTKSFLQSKGLVSNNPMAFKTLLSDLWFTMYSRGNNKIGSSAFEHIFLAELKNKVVAGLHNWLYFSHAEKLGKANYMGWLKKIQFPSKAGTGVMKLKYSWGTSLKHANSLFIGTSPELEVALYTVCFLARPNDKCHLSMDGKKFFIQTYSFQYRGKSLIGSAYPVI